MSEDRPEWQRFLDRMELAPLDKEVSVIASTYTYDEEAASTGKVTMRELCGFGVVSRKTIAKHIAAGLLTGRKVRVRGIMTWLFEPGEAKRYLESVVDLVEQSVRDKPNRPKRFEPLAGYLTLPMVAASAGVSKWTVHDSVAKGEIAVASVGPHGVKLVAEAEADRYATAMAGRGRGPRVREKIVRPGPRDRRAFVIGNRMLLIWLVLDQPGESATALAKDLSVGVQTVRNWQLGNTEPDDLNTAKIVAYARGRYAIRVSPELDELGKRYRRDYMVGYYRELRAEHP